jgi:hypothetical protein
MMFAYSTSTMHCDSFELVRCCLLVNHFGPSFAPFACHKRNHQTLTPRSILVNFVLCMVLEDNEIILMDFYCIVIGQS